MAWTQINLYGPTVADSDIEALQSTTDTQRRGYDFVVFTNIGVTNTSAPAVEIGSVLEVNGSLFEVDTSNITIGSVPGGATSDLYVKLTVTGSNPATLTADWTITAPSWDTAKGGWFDGSTKYLNIIADYDGASAWSNKRFLNEPYGTSADGWPILVKRVQEIGTWDMNATSQVLVSHTLPDNTKVREVSVMIVNDLQNAVYPLNKSDNTTVADNAGQVRVISAASITLERATGGFFDSTTFDDTTINRGWIVFTYEV
jgi:hypothetical protein